MNAKCNIWVCFSIIILIAGSCKDQKDQDLTTGYYTITGSVIDQVTKQPVAGATIIFGSLPVNEFSKQLVNSGRTVTSGQDGRYKILVPVSALDPEEIRHSLNFPKIYAEKDNYVGSNYLVPPKGGEMESNIELYHKASLILLVKNDTINNQIDEVDIALMGSSDFMSYPGFIGKTTWDFRPYTIIKNCIGRNFNSSFEFYPLWGNLTYTLTLIKSGQAWGYPGYSAYTVTLKPDSITYFSILF